MGSACNAGYSNDYLGAYFAVGNSYYPDSHEGGNVPKVVPYTGIQGTNRSGAIAVFMHEMLTRANVPWEEVPLSNEAWALSPDSSFTACCYEVRVLGVPKSLLPSPATKAAPHS